MAGGSSSLISNGLDDDDDDEVEARRAPKQPSMRINKGFCYQVPSLPPTSLSFLYLFFTQFLPSGLSQEWVPSAGQKKDKNKENQRGR